MSLIQTINRAGKRLFIHFHDEAEFKETEHPRGKGGKFVKSGTGGGGTSGVSATAKPTPAKGAVVVDPVAKILKSHGYEKQKGTNTFKHPTGHEVEVHAASEGQKWLTGWTHGTTGNTGSGAGKLDKYLQSLPHGGFTTPAVKQEPDPFEKKMAELSSYKPKSPPKTSAEYPPMNFGGPGATFLKQPIQAKPGVQHPLPKVHSALSGMLGFVPTGQNTTTTTYEHPDKGKVVVKNKTYKSGIHKGQASWEYFKPGGKTPTKIGYGINNGQLQQAIQAHAPSQPQAPTPPPSSTPAKSDVVKPSWAKYENSEGSLWPGLYGGEKESAIRYYAGEANNATETLIIGTGENTKGQWQLYTKEGGVVATGEGQESLNQAFESLHPRGEGGKFIAKPGSKEDKLAQKVITYSQPLMDLGWKPYGEDDDNVWFEKGNSGIEVSKESQSGTGNLSWTISAPYQEIMTGEGKGNLLNKLKEIEGGEISPTAGVVTVVKQDPDFGTFNFAAGYGSNYEQSTTTEFSNGLHLVKSNETDKWEIIDNEGLSVQKGNGEIALGNTSKKLGLPESLSGGKSQFEAENEELFQQLGSPKDIGGYTFPHKEGGSYVTEEATQQELSNGMKLIQSTKSGKWEITDPVGGTEYYGSTQEKLDYVLKNNLGLAGGQPASSTSTSNALASVFSPFKTKGFDITTDPDTGGVAGVLQNDAKVKMAFSYWPKENKGIVSSQIVGDPAGSKTQVVNGTAAEFYNKVVEHHDEATAGPAPPKVQHFTASDPLPAELNGIAFSEYVPSNNWNTVEGTNEHIQEPPMVPKPGKKISAGVLIEEPDGRVWLVKPKDEFGGYKFTFPKGGQELGMTLQETAIKEAWEESGLKAEITGYAGDYEGDTSVTRYYYAKRTGGTPTGYQPSETEQVTLVPKEELHQYLNKARDLQIAKDHFMPKAIGRVIHFNSMVKVGEKKGSNPGGIYQSPSGKKYYIKMPKSNQHAANELLAAELMAKAGGGTLKYHQIVDNGKNYVGTEWENLQKDNVSKLSLNERKMAQSDFAINAWLANWDAAGTGGDNTGILNGKPVTLDVGGSLLYRAQGTPKGALFGDNPTEWGTLRDATINPDAAKLYGDMTPQQMKESAEKLNNITNKDIQDAVHNHFDVQDIVGDDLIDKLIARRDKIIQWGSLIPSAPKLAPTLTPQPTYVPPPTPSAPLADVYPKQHGLNKWSGNTEYQSLLKVAPLPNKVEGGAVSKYSGGAYGPWNRALRNSFGNDSAGHPTKALMNYLAKSSFPEERIVKRRVDNDFAEFLMAEAEEDEAEFVDHGFSSTDHWSGKLTLRIRVPQGAQAAAIGHYSLHPGEDEILIQAGSKYRITNYDKSTHTMDVDLLRSGPPEAFAKKHGLPVGVWHKKTKGS